jgi:hypothetical protein
MTLKSTIQGLTLLVAAVLILGAIDIQMSYGYPGHPAGMLWLVSSYFAKALFICAVSGAGALMVLFDLDTITSAICWLLVGMGAAVLLVSIG